MIERPTSSVGRPRRFDDQTERKMLIDAALRTMSDGREGSISINEVLAEAGLSTRALYRHFDSKEALAEALMLREAEWVGNALNRVVAQAPNPVAAIEAWLERFLDVFYEPRRARRAALLTSATQDASRLSVQLMSEMRHMSCVSLVDALRAGHAQGVLRSPTPEADAYTIFNLVTAAREAGDVGTADRDGVRNHVTRYAWPALGLPTGAG